MVARKDTPNQRRLENLPARQWNVIIYLARGYTHERIASETGDLLRNVRYWTERMRQLLDVETVREVPYAFYRRTGNNPFTMRLRSTEDE